MRLSSLLVPALLGSLLAACGADGSAEERETLSRKAPTSIGSAARDRPSDGWSVVGVARGDRLNVRRTPGVEGAVVARLAPMASGLRATGRSQRVGAERWMQVRVDGARGWANARYLARLGTATSATRDFRTVSASPTRLALARAVARRWAASAEGPARPVVVRVDDRAIILDVFGAGDDSVSGARLRVVSEMGEAGFLVGRVSAAPMCVRGVTPEGLCV